MFCLIFHLPRFSEEYLCLYFEKMDGNPPATHQVCSKKPTLTLSTMTAGAYMLTDCLDGSSKHCVC